VGVGVGAVEGKAVGDAVITGSFVGEAVGDAVITGGFVGEVVGNEEGFFVVLVVGALIGFLVGAGFLVGEAVVGL